MEPPPPYSTLDHSATVIPITASTCYVPTSQPMSSCYVQQGPTFGSMASSYVVQNTQEMPQTANYIPEVHNTPGSAPRYIYAETEVRPSLRPYNSSSRAAKICGLLFTAVFVIGFIIIVTRIFDTKKNYG